MADSKHGIDQDLVRQLAMLLKETELTEIEIEQNDFRIRVSRATAPAMHTVQVAAPAAPGAAASAAGASAASASTDPLRNPGCIPSPMVGTVYRASEPGTRAFVEVGDTVRAGQTILIVEAMKHMNEVAAPRAGKVTAIYVEDNQPVEFGEPLMIIE